MKINGKLCLNIFKAILTRMLILAVTKKEAISLFESKFKGIKLSEEVVVKAKGLCSTGILRVLNE